MATLEPDRTKNSFSAAALALDLAIEQAVDRAPGVLSGTTFVPANLAHASRVHEYRRVGPVTIVDAEGNETRLSQDRTVEFVAVAVAVGLMIWLAARSGSKLPA